MTRPYTTRSDADSSYMTQLEQRIAELEAERDRLRRVLEGIRDNPRYDRGAVGAFNDCRKIAALALNKAGG